MMPCGITFAIIGEGGTVDEQSEHAMLFRLPLIRLFASLLGELGKVSVKHVS